MRTVIRVLKVFGAIGVGIAAFGATQALAAGLGTSGQALGGGQQTISACTSDVLKVSYDTSYSPTAGAYVITGVTLTDIAPAPDLAGCAGEAYQVTLLGSAGASLAQVSGVVPSGAVSFASAVNAVAPVDASMVTAAAVVIGS
jgi:hypothetical protein